MSQSLRFGIPQSDMDRIIKELKKSGLILRAVLFGSRALGKFREGSDIDIAIDAPSMNHSTMLRLCTELDDLMIPQKIDIVLLHQIDNPALTDHIQRVGIELL